MGNIIEKSTIESENRQLVLDGRSFSRNLRNQQHVSDIIYDRDWYHDVDTFAHQLAVADGYITVPSMDRLTRMGPSGRRPARTVWDSWLTGNPFQIRDHLRNWAQQQEILEQFVAENPLGALRSGDPRAVDEALRAISTPRHGARTEAVMDAARGLLTPAERLQVQSYNLQKLFQDAMTETESKRRLVMGDKIIDYLSRYDRAQQDFLFGPGVADDLREMAGDFKYVFSNIGMDYGASQAAAEVTTRSFLNPRGFHKRIAWLLSDWVTSRPRVLDWLLDTRTRDPSTYRRTLQGLGWLLANQAANMGPGRGRPKKSQPTPGVPGAQP